MIVAIKLKNLKFHTNRVYHEKKSKVKEFKGVVKLLGW